MPASPQLNSIDLITAVTAGRNALLRLIGCKPVSSSGG